jgi:hypothetical protein
MYAIMFGTSSLAIAYRLHRVHREMDEVLHPKRSASLA